VSDYTSHSRLRLRSFALVAMLLSLGACAGGAGSDRVSGGDVSAPVSANCGADALGTERTITLPRTYAAFGTAQHGPLPLKPGEVVLTFDDGPSPVLTRKVLDALAAQCVKATFFTVGQNLRDHPDIARQEAAQGHSVGIHSYTHPDLSKLTPAEQLADLDKTVEAYKTVFGQPPAAYRFPFLAETPTMIDALKARSMSVWSVDLGVDDWQPGDTPEILRDRLVSRLKASGGGIILLHDANGPTAEAVPLLLKTLKDGGYKVVHIQWEAP
jgi:peptidoglycan-N-acetylglucosamine deacetylase